MPTKTIKFAFRGLMMFNYQQDDATGKNFMEIGFLDARIASPGGGGHMGHTPPSAVHVPRILTMEDGLLASVFDLRGSPALGLVREWELDVVSDTGVELEGPENFDRTVPPDANTKRYFRWITDFEGADLHDRDLTSEIRTSNLLLVLTVRHGKFFTKMVSPPLSKEKNEGDSEEYGFAAAVTGCDITFDEAGGNGIKLRAVGDNNFVTTFNPKDGVDTIYEFSNAPPDVPADAPVPVGEGNHFHMYYDKLFIKPPTEQFEIFETHPRPSPDPATCGVGLLSRRTTGL